MSTTNNTIGSNSSSSSSSTTATGPEQQQPKQQLQQQQKEKENGSNINNLGNSNRSLPLRSNSTFSLSTSQSSLTRMGSLNIFPQQSHGQQQQQQNSHHMMGVSKSGVFPVNQSSSSIGSFNSLNSSVSGYSSLSHSSSSLLYEPLSLQEIKEPIYDIRGHIQNLDRIRQEFRFLEEYTIPSETSEGDKKHNSMKNRYTNILPCNTTRVILEKIGDKEGTDYINANFIDGIMDKQYICTQGPLQNTILDFWRMVWENGSSIIVMLSREQENCRPKCDRYWPDQLKDMAANHWSEQKFSCHLMEISRDDQREIVIRKLLLKNLQTAQQRNIIHYQYEGWPDHNAPQDTEPLRHLLHLINDYQSSLSLQDQLKPIVVHCSAGVGRTGTFCTVHIILKKLEKYYLKFQHQPPVDYIDFNLFNIVLNLRAQRPGMVQQFEQYIFCYQTILDEIDEKYSQLFPSLYSSTNSLSTSK
ncbi:protein-tyrosine phosphatase 1 [Tieghemostelium lacteum]|uniref:protein-tyrosine-phosphatase n=1 Tax=Tieghemostelium lacteum TaxID=361077 RepID=A0A152A3R6_TIELA|nr:protein-tyrosine phosphatase 1 [Tieghemostelium lacteum]|eukprot:KYR00888.1 protein-tyrosine phosphatase 1 [Tieghemostelium lacteum]